MTISITPTFSEISEGNPLSVGTLAYLRERLRTRLHQFVLAEFVRREETGALKRKDFATRIRKKPEQITRWLGAPSNWTIDTVSDLLAGMGIIDIEFRVAHQLGALNPANELAKTLPFKETIQDARPNYDLVSRLLTSVYGPQQSGPLMPALQGRPRQLQQVA